MDHPKETRLQEIKRCLDRATELGGKSLGDEANYIGAPYDLDVSDVRYLYDKLMKVRNHCTLSSDLVSPEYIERLIDND